MKEQVKLTRWTLLKSLLNNIDPQEMRDALRSEDQVMVIDCRRVEEFQQGSIPGAVNIDYLAPDFWERIEKLDPERVYFVYCRTGRRSVRTCTLMQNGGFQRVFHLDGGLDAWIAQFGPAALESVPGKKKV